jgi:hypothetical protein
MSEDRIAKLEAEVARLKKAHEPKESFVQRAPHVPYDPMKNISMPRSALNDLVRAVPDSLVRDIARDHVGRSTALPTTPSVSPGHNRGNFAPERSLKVDGVDLCDRGMDVQDKIDRKERAKRLGVKPTA